MKLERQWCDQPRCRDFAKIDAGNIQVHSNVERRFYCTTCLHTFSADANTFFETLRSERREALDVLALLGERNSLRGIERLKHCRPNTVLHWLDLAGQQLAAVSAELIHDVRVSQAQVDELWTFVKKSKSTVSLTIPPMWVTCGSGGPLPCPVACGSSAISVRSAVKWKRPGF